MTSKDDKYSGNPPAFAPGVAVSATEPEIMVEAEPEIVVAASAIAPSPYASNTGASIPFAQALDAEPSKPPFATSTTTTTTYTVNPPTATAPSHAPMMYFGMEPTGIQCPHCSRQCITKTRRHPDIVTILAIIALILLFWPLFWLPLCIPGCQTTEHYCSCCHRKVGQAKPCS